MRALTAADIIRVWEVGHGQDPADRALTILASACPGRSADELRRLSLGRRNAQLLELRQRLLGAELSAFSECPGCAARLEFSVPVDARGDEETLQAAADTVFDLVTGGYTVRFRLLDTTDLRAAAVAADVDAARRVLVERCVLEARDHGDVLTAAELPAPVLEQLAARLTECDPHAETLIDLVCPACESRWQVPFDVASFFYTEISAQARRLLREVHTLARAYAWRESDILAMSARRRQYYMEMAG
jgi:hypothetical protein